MSKEYQLMDELLPYQKKWVLDKARWKMGLMARQVGKDHAAAFEGMIHCALADAAGQKTDWLIVAPSERQSMESFQKWKEVGSAMNILFEDQEIKREGGPETMLQYASLRFQHGSRIMAVPGKPETVRGFSANVLFTEFAFFENAEETWKAVFPSVSNGFQGRKMLRIITTPNGVGNKAHEIWMQGTSGQLLPSGRKSPWKCHFVDIHKAVKQGLQCDIEEMKAALNDPAAWAQEFLCEFHDLQATLLPYELIAGCESNEATSAVPQAYWEANPPHQRVMGIDFGRIRNMTVACTGDVLGDVFHTKEVLCLRAMPTPEQRAILTPRIQAVHRVCFDYTGPGIGLGDELVRHFGAYDPARNKFGKIELCTFTNPFKQVLFAKLHHAFENKRLRIPVDRALREDLHSVIRCVSAHGAITYRALGSADGNADRCTALALALRAMATVSNASSFEIVPREAPGGFSAASQQTDNLNRIAQKRWPGILVSGRQPSRKNWPL
jgi:phage FluMu gp28-like protein